MLVACIVASNSLKSLAMFSIVRSEIILEIIKEKCTLRLANDLLITKQAT